MSTSASILDELPVPEVTYDKYDRPSVKLEGSDNVSLESEPLHELAILREHGRWAMSLITRYLNKQHGQNYTGAQIVRIWRQLRYQQEEAESVHAGQVLVVWREEFRNAVSQGSKKKLFEELMDVTFKRFFDQMGSDLDNSEITIDPELDRLAEDEVNFGPEVEGIDYSNRARGKWTAEETNFFKHQYGAHFIHHQNQDKSTEQNIAEGIERAEKKKAYEDDLRKFKEAFFKGDNKAQIPWVDDPKYKMPITKHGKFRETHIHLQTFEEDRAGKVVARRRFEQERTR
ncbi:MAG: hypothetical protein L6R42_002678 [Xanthoria sp. 1 TBL-2021]|nr:MAG: hypothetical protein L6R42_002678 [Xanthoria sp. 1 TBL-2021]